MEKFDIKKALRTFYGAPVGEFSVVEVPPLNYFMIDGAGDPNTESDYKAAVEALYAASYTLKFMSKAALQRDYVVPPLEGLWWSDDMADFVARRKDRWRWTMMIAVPDFVAAAMARDAIVKASEKKQLPALHRLRFDGWRKVGPYRRCISALTTTKARSCNACIRNSCRRTSSLRQDITTRFT